MILRAGGFVLTAMCLQSISRLESRDTEQNNHFVAKIPQLQQIIWELQKPGYPTASFARFLNSYCISPAA
jgi:hypothetical protein